MVRPGPQALISTMREIKQWTNVLGVSQTPTTTDTPQSGWTRTRYDDGSGTVQVEAYSIAGAGHVLPESGMAAYAINFFGLNTPPTTPPPTSPPPTSPPPGACHVTYTKSSEWAGGFVASVTIDNTGSTAVSGWQLAFTFPGDQKITNAWNAAVSQSGNGVTAASLSYDATISTGGNVSFGFQGTWTSNDTAPTSFSLNGTACI
jgi:poly(3-hydroxybutyrate) depolymerase